jgi:outer membrane beta-barrel protein
MEQENFMKTRGTANLKNDGRLGRKAKGNRAFWAMALIAAAAAFAPKLALAGASSDLESLGGNDAVDSRAARLSSTYESAVVQGRKVDLNNRLEVSAIGGVVGGGNSYFNTQTAGVMADWHFIPQFSLGIRYEQSFNQLTNEGNAAFSGASAQNAQSNSYSYPDLDYPDHSIMGTATWYMFYGKMNFFDLRVVQFDIYAIGGAGQMTTSRDVSPTYTGGGGIAFWLTQHISSRFEVRYQTYKDNPYSGEQTINEVIGNFAIGFLL